MINTTQEIIDSLKKGKMVIIMDDENRENEGDLVMASEFVKANDIKLMQKIKCYKGIRHYYRLPLRGQRTKSNFRRNKAKASSLKKK